MAVLLSDNIVLRRVATRKHKSQAVELYKSKMIDLIYCIAIKMVYQSVGEFL